ncbi:hypothetical protein DPMN_163685 [Dreissena polymorpha]|uniref:Uncharacterized protein n=1 Tax=Dreissena polymorpha TaxID=45954 RepID=A0A9D4ESN3_DREPO|nr:hypothetical protein DPMN_163685 [Dreissena polymorpha]
MSYDELADLPSPLRKLPLPLGIIEDVGCDSPMAMESSFCATETIPGPSAKTVSSALVSVAG